MSETNSRMNPLMAAAAVAVIIFSAVGVAVMTGVIPGAKSAGEASVQAPAAPETKTAAVPGANTAAMPETKAPAVPAHKAAVAQKRSPAPEHKPQQVAVNERTAAPPPPAPRICTECGVIDAIDVVEKKGAGTGLGAVGGAVVGGLLGNQIGKGRGNTAATVVGVVGGAVAGNEVEKRVKAVSEYHVTVRMDDGKTQSFTYDSAPGYVVGEKVKVIDGRLVRG